MIYIYDIYIYILSIYIYMHMIVKERKNTFKNISASCLLQLSVENSFYNFFLYITVNKKE